MRKASRTIVAFIAGVAGCASFANAGAVVFNFIEPYTGDVVPGAGGGGPPYMTATFEDIAGSPGDVRLTLSTEGLSAPDEFVSRWLFNLDPNLAASQLSFTYDNSSALDQAVGSSNYSFVKREDELSLGGQAVGFDFGTLFSTANKDSVRFSADERFVGTLSSTQAGLTANSFKFLNAGDGNSDVFFYGVAHVQGIQGGLSTKLGAELAVVPLPAAVWAGLALMGVIGAKRLRQRGLR